MPEHSGKKRKRTIDVGAWLSKYRDIQEPDFATAFKRMREDLFEVEEGLQSSIPTLAATSLSHREAREMFDIIATANVLWIDIDLMEVPADLLVMIAKIQAITSEDGRNTEAYSRIILDQIIISSIWEENFGDGKSPVPAEFRHAIQQEEPALLQLRHETHIQRKVKFEGRDRLLTGFADYSLWYDTRDKILATNLLIVEAKKQGRTDDCLPQLLAYMGAVHATRKDEGKRNSTVFGVASDGNLFRFCRIDNDGKWSQSAMMEWNGGFQSNIYTMFRRLIRIAALSSPTTSPIKDPTKRERVLAEFGTPSRSKYDFGIKDLEIFEVDSDDEDFELVGPPRSKEVTYRAGGAED